MKALIFDLYDTILNDTFFDFHTGLSRLHELQFSEECTEEDFLTFSMSFIPLYKNREQTNDEINFLRHEYLTYCDQLEVPPLQSAEELQALDFDVMTHMQKEELLPEVKSALDFLKEKNVPMYLMTNSIFLSSSHKKLLSQFGLENHFKDLFSSTDFGKRKPDPSFFQYAAETVLQQNPELKPEDIIFIGNDFYDDVVPALNLGFTAFWYNQAKEDENTEPDDNTAAELAAELKVKTFTSFKDLLSLLSNM